MEQENYIQGSYMRREHLAIYRSTFTMTYITQVVVLHTQQAASFT